MTGDGKPDVVVANSESHYLSVLSNLGNGTFGPAVPYAAGNYPASVAIGDVTGDGKNDVVVTDLLESTVNVYANTGTGSLAVRVAYGSLPSPRGLALANVAGDSKLDIIVAEESQGLTGQQLSVFANIGGTFPSHADYVVGGARSPVLTMGDIDNDGRLDAIVIGTNPDVIDTIGIAYGLASGGFGLAVPYVSLSVIGTAVADLNGDGKLDIVSFTSSGAHFLLNQGNRNFSQPGRLSTGFLPYRVAVRDIDRDGADDIVVAGTESGAGVFFGDGHGGFAPLNVQAGVGSLTTILVGDVDGDGVPDVVFPGSYGMAAIVWLTHGRNFTTLSAPMPQDAMVSALVDLDHDGRRELVAVDRYGSMSVMKFRNNAFAGTPPVQVGVPIGLATGDLNRDGNLDVFVAAEGGACTAFLGDGNGGWSATLVSACDSSVIVLADIDGNGVLDLVTSNGINHGNGDGTFGPRVDVFTGTLIATRDFDGDGHLDIVAQPMYGVFHVSLNNNDGTFRARSYLGASSAIAVGDFNADGRPDIVTLHGATSRNEVNVNFGRCLP